MRILVVGGSGTISSAVIQRALALGHDVTCLNRGHERYPVPASCEVLLGDINDEAAARELLGGRTWDVVCDFVVFTPDQAERDIRLFRGRCSQYVFISTASAYHKPANYYVIDEGASLHNPYWQYSRDKAACERVYMEAYRNEGFPVTIVRPSHTYGDQAMPTALHGSKGSYPVLARMLAGKPVIVPGDGLTLWTVTYNTDFAWGFCGLLGQVQAVGEAVQITSDERLTWNQIYQIIGYTLGVEPRMIHVSSEMLMMLDPELEGPLLGDKSNNAVFDNSKIRRLVPGFEPKMPFSLGSRRVWRYLSAHEELRVEDPAFDAWCDDVADRVMRFA